MYYPLLLDLGTEGQVLFYEEASQCFYQDRSPRHSWNPPKSLNWIKQGSPWCVGLRPEGEFLLAYASPGGLVACSWQPGSARQEKFLPLAGEQKPLFLNLLRNKEGESELILATGHESGWNLYRGRWGRKDWPELKKLLEENKPAKAVFLLPAGRLWHLFVNMGEEYLRHTWFSPQDNSQGRPTLPGPLAGQKFFALAGNEDQALLAWLAAANNHYILRRWLRPGWPAGEWQTPQDMGTFPEIKSMALLKKEPQTLYLTWSDDQGLWSWPLDLTGQPTGEPSKIDAAAGWQVYRFQDAKGETEKKAWGLEFPPRRLLTSPDLSTQESSPEVISGTAENTPSPALQDKKEWQTEILYAITKLENMEKTLMGHPVPRVSLSQNCLDLIEHLKKLL